VIGALAATSGACSSATDRETAPPLGAGSGGGDDDFIDAGGPSGPPKADAGGLCGNAILPIAFDAPNIYFVLDHSGSMSAPAGGSTRYGRVRGAVIDLVHRLGPRINVGAALFPLGENLDDFCNVGGEVLPVSPGDPTSGPPGPTTQGFTTATKLPPFGGTPTAATLELLLPTVSSLAGRTIVVLATDGAPNCNAKVACDKSACMANIEGQCSPKVNCCAEDPTGCVDRLASIKAVAAYKDAGIPVYVVGITGSEFYKDLLADMALAGGAPQVAPPFYYQVNDLGSLRTVLGSIASLVVSCEFTLSEEPPDPGFTNVYFDKQVVPQDGADGWVWKGGTTVELRGEACARLKNGEVTQVQIVSGCPTEAAK
jgi:hypothetical protein